jgi:hypothetical protein
VTFVFFSPFDTALCFIFESDLRQDRLSSQGPSKTTTLSNTTRMKTRRRSLIGKRTRYPLRNRLGAIVDLFLQRTVGFIDPSVPHNPGWPLRNPLTYLRTLNPTASQSIRIPCWRDAVRAWHILPALDLDKIAATRCLWLGGLWLGAGTVGCCAAYSWSAHLVIEDVGPVHVAS